MNGNGAKRETNGRFAKGNGGGPGRPRLSVEERYLGILRRTVTNEDWEKIVLVAIARAKAGDKSAREWLSHYLIGKPTEYINIDATSNGQTLGGLLADVRRTLTTEDDDEDLAPA